MEAGSEATPLELTGFVQLCLNEKILEEHEIRNSVLSIGRSPECDIVIDNAAVSAFHALLSYRQGKLSVEDAASTNGILADGSKASSFELNSGESVQIAGKYSLRLVEAPSSTASSVKLKQSTSSHEIQAETMLVNTTMLSKMGQNTRPAYLTMTQTGKPSWIVRLDKSCTSIGRKGDIRVGGMLTSSQIASIERREDGFYLIAAKPDQVAVAGKTLTEAHRFDEGDRFQVKDVIGVFHERANRS